MDPISPLAGHFHIPAERMRACEAVHGDEILYRGTWRRICSAIQRGGIVVLNVAGENEPVRYYENIPLQIRRGVS